MNVIIGTGIIGASTAYYLTRSNKRVTILDPALPGSGASGQSAGFITRNGSGPATDSLAKLSFQLHDDLAQEHGGPAKWGYQRCRVHSAVGRVGRDEPGQRVVNHTSSLQWIKPGVVMQNQSLLEDEDKTAQWYRL